MAATGKPLTFTHRPVHPMTPDDAAKLTEIAAARGETRTETVRALIREEHARLTCKSQKCGER